jgi:hypothetical protein
MMMGIQVGAEDNTRAVGNYGGGGGQALPGGVGAKQVVLPTMGPPLVTQHKRGGAQSSALSTALQSLPAALRQRPPTHRQVPVLVQSRWQKGPCAGEPGPTHSPTQQPVSSHAQSVSLWQPDAASGLTDEAVRSRTASPAASASTGGCGDGDGVSGCVRQPATTIKTRQRCIRPAHSSYVPSSPPRAPRLKRLSAAKIRRRFQISDGVSRERLKRASGYRKSRRSCHTRRSLRSMRIREAECGKPVTSPEADYRARGTRSISQSRRRVVPARDRARMKIRGGPGRPTKARAPSARTRNRDRAPTSSR